MKRKHIKSICLIVIISSILFSLSACKAAYQSSQLGRGQGFMGRGEYAKAYSILRPLADEGILPAQYLVGIMLREGKGTQINIPLAIRFWQQSADKGYPLSFYKLGLEYKKGDNLPNDNVLAYSYFLLSTKAGDSYGGQERDSLSKELSDEQKLNAEQMAKEYLTKHPNFPNPPHR